MIKSEVNLVASARSSSPANMGCCAGGLSRLEEGSVADSTSSGNQSQGQEAAMSASGFVHARGEHVSPFWVCSKPLASNSRAVCRERALKTNDRLECLQVYMDSLSSELSAICTEP